MPVIDLSYPIGPHFRWPVQCSTRGDHTAGDVFRVTTVETTVHGFSHVDAKKHIDPDGDTIENLELERVIGQFEILDLSAIEDDAPIDADILKVAAQGRSTAERWLLKTDWPARRSINCREFWTQAPFVTRDGAQWLFESGAMTVAFDFPQDRTIRQLLDGGPCPPLEEHVTHDLLLKRGVTLIEYVANTQALTTSSVWLAAAPLKIAGADGAPARIFALSPTIDRN